MDDAVASARAECVDPIFMVNLHFLLLSSSLREQHPILALVRNSTLTREPIRRCGLSHARK